MSDEESPEPVTTTSEPEEPTEPEESTEPDESKDSTSKRFKGLFQTGKQGQSQQLEESHHVRLSIQDESSFRSGGSNPHITEFMYYSSMLRSFGPAISSESDRNFITPWIRKLFRPEYQSTKLRDKRNRYLAFLTTSLLLDEVAEIFHRGPPEGILPDITKVHPIPIGAATWEVDNMWQETLQNLPEDFMLLECYDHEDPDECRKEHAFDKILDQEFQFFLYLAKPYSSLITGGVERTRVAAWLQILCSVHGKECCSKMRATRNDYMMTLLGYIQDLRAAGPFAEYPSMQILKPLAKAAKEVSENNAITDPTGCYTNEFMADQPMPDDGAFCYIAISGDLVTSNITGT